MIGFGETLPLSWGSFQSGVACRTCKLALTALWSKYLQKVSTGCHSRLRRSIEDARDRRNSVYQAAWCPGCPVPLIANFLEVLPCSSRWVTLHISSRQPSQITKGPLVGPSPDIRPAQRD